MGKKLIIVIALLNILVVVGISFAQISEPTLQTTQVYRFADLTEVEESFATLNRFENGLTAAISTDDLVEGDVYTLWWVNFDEPQNCTDGACSEDDIFLFDNGELVPDGTGNFALNMEQIEAADITIQHAAGGYAVDNSFNTSASLGLGDAPGIVVGNGLDNPFESEIHLVVRTHGEAQVEAFADQISTFGGGCDPIMQPPCVDVQFAVFAPVQ